MEFFKQYPSGIRLVAKRMDNFYTVSLGVYVDVGSILCRTPAVQGNAYAQFATDFRRIRRYRRKSKRLYKQGFHLFLHKKCQ